MRILVTGATGFLGINLCNELVKRGYIVNALYRSESKAKSIKHSNIHLFKGEIFLKPDSIPSHIKGSFDNFIRYF